MREVLNISVQKSIGRSGFQPDLDIIALMVIATFTEKPVVYDAVDVKLIEERIAILGLSALAFRRQSGERTHTFDTDAVNTTTSYNSPTLFINWSTPGRLITYTLWYWPSISTGIVKSA